MEKKVVTIKGKNYFIGEDGIVFEENGKETKDIKCVQNHYHLQSYPLHRIVYQLFKGEIPKGYCCHHINTCAIDNRISNLILIPKNEHRKLHADISRHRQFKKHLIDSAQPHYYKPYNEKNCLHYGSSNQTFSIAKFEKHWSNRKKELRIDELSEKQLKQLLHPASIHAV